jgi:hypothetical protein
MADVFWLAPCSAPRAEGLEFALRSVYEGAEFEPSLL